MSRHKAREAAFQMLFQLLEGENEWQMTGGTLAEARLTPDNETFARKLAEGAWSKRFEMEQYIRKFAASWQYERLFSVDKVLLHLAMYELKYLPETPSPIVINEAVELAKQYGTDDSAPFVNAVLDNFRIKALEQQQPEYQPDETAIANAQALYEKKAQALAVSEPEYKETPKPQYMPITEQMGKRGFRKISKREQTAADKILPEPEDEEPFRRSR